MRLLETYKRIGCKLFWKGMKQNNMRYVVAYEVCQQQKYQETSLTGLLPPLTLSTIVWEDVSLDFHLGPSKSQRFDTLLQ